MFQAQFEMDIGRVRRRYAPQSGVLQGSSLGGAIFNYPYWTQLKGWPAEMMVSNRELIYDSVVTGKKLYMGMTSFVDDVAAAQVGHDAQEVLDDVHEGEERFDEYLGRMGARQNRIKNVAVADLVEPRSRALLRDKRRAGQLQSFARYLGPLLRYDVSFKVEVKARIAAAGRAYKVFRSFLASSARLSVRILVFRSVVQDTLISGLVSFPLSRNEVDQLEAAQNKMARAMLCGDACKKEVMENGKRYSAVTTAEVRRRLRLARVQTELIVQRLRTWQKVLGDMKNHEMYLTAVLGRREYEQDADGNPWLVQAQNDFGQLPTIDEMAWVVQGCNGDIRKLLQDSYAAELRAFLAYDLRVLRERERCVAIPPPDWSEPGRAAADAPVPLPSQGVDEHPQFVCGAVLKEGVICTYVADSPTQLAMHKARARDHCISSVVAFVRVNQCPWCASTFATRQSACRHVLWSFSHGGCVVDCAFRPSPLQEHADLVCPLCSATFVGLACYNAHIRRHISPGSIDLEPRVALVALPVVALPVVDNGPRRDYVDRRLLENWRRRRQEAQERPAAEHDGDRGAADPDAERDAGDRQRGEYERERRSSRR